LHTLYIGRGDYIGYQEEGREEGEEEEEVTRTPPSMSSKLSPDET
jgi:hypothetical protein